MISGVKELITSYEFMSMLALWTYWIPLSVVLVTYLFRFISMYREDLSKCENKHYQPSLTIGVIIFHLLCAITPAINLFALVFDCASAIFVWFGRTFDIALVRHKPKMDETD